MAQTQINGATQIRSGSIISDRIAAGTIADDRLENSYIYANGTRSFTGNVDLDGYLINNLGTPVSSSDAATKEYVDGLIQGFDWKQSVRAATTEPGTLSSAFKNNSVIDGVTLVTGDRILIKDQTNTTENGIYVVNANGAPTRSGDANADADFTSGLTVFVSEGNTYGNSAWSITTHDPISVGNSAVVFNQVAGGSLYKAGDGLSLDGSTFNIGAADSSITVNADSIQVRISEDGSLGVNPSDGLHVTWGTGGQVYIANANGVLTPTTLSGDVSSVSDTGSVSLIGDIARVSNYVNRESPNGSINGTNTVFSLQYTPQEGTESVFLNGILQEPGAGNDYAIANNVITFADAPVSDDRIRVTYFK
jgi:hypothetical protein